MIEGRHNPGGRREPVFDAPVDAPAPRPRKRKKHSKKIPARGSLVTRAIYWMLVLSLWIVIGGIGAVVWVGAHLPPIQSLEIPKRPPSIQIVDLQAIRSPPAATWAAPCRR